jgi:hypothetical protein
VLGDMQIASDRRGRRARRIPEHLSMANSKMLRKSAIRHAQEHEASCVVEQPAYSMHSLPDGLAFNGPGALRVSAPIWTPPVKQRVIARSYLDSSGQAASDRTIAVSRNESRLLWHPSLHVASNA